MGQSRLFPQQFVKTHSLRCSVSHEIVVRTSFQSGSGNCNIIYFIHHTCFQFAETQQSWVFPSLQCHYKTMFFVCGICSNFTALVLFCTHCSVHSFLICVLTMGYGDSFILFYLRMLLLAPAQATVNPRVFFPSDRTTHTSSII